MDAAGSDKRLEFPLLPTHLPIASGKKVAAATSSTQSQGRLSVKKAPTTKAAMPMVTTNLRCEVAQSMQRRRLTPALSGRTLPYDPRLECAIPKGARGARALTHHGPLERVVRRSRIDFNVVLHCRERIVEVMQ